MTYLVFTDEDNVRDSYWGTVNIPDEFLVGADDIKDGGLVHFFEPMGKTWLTMQSQGKGKGFQEVSQEDLDKQTGKNKKEQKAGEQPPNVPTKATTQTTGRNEK